MELNGPTRGAAETALLGLQGMPERARNRPVMIMDGDTFYENVDVISMYRDIASTHGGCFVFNDTQPQPIYSYCRLQQNAGADEIVEIREKVKISDWANSGCYCFRDGNVLAGLEKKKFAMLKLNFH